MPIYLYRCTACGCEFEELVSAMGDAPSFACPECKSADTERKQATFAARMGSSFNAPCGSPAPT